MSTRDDDVVEFAALLRQLKARTDRSYGSLARRLHMNTSTLHRYCAGEAVPLDFAPLERFAALCGASPDERLELHRRWIQAVAARQRPRSPDAPGDRTAPTALGAPSPPTENSEATEASETPEAQAIAATAETAEAQAIAETPEAPETPQPPAPSNDAPTPHTRPWYRRRRTLTVALASALLAVLASLLALSTDNDTSTPEPPKSPKSPKPSASPTTFPAPLTWTADSQAWEIDCDHDYVIRKQPQQVPPPPVEQDAAAWAATQGAVHGRETLVQIAVQGRSSTAVILKALRVRVVGRDTPLQGTAYSMAQGCGGDMTPRAFSVGLDAHRPTVRSLPGSDGFGKPVPARHLPYRVSATDPEALEVKALTEDCDCRWYLELDWSSEGHTGTLRIDDHGRPFRTSGIKGLPRYWYAGGGWTPIVT